MIISVVVASCKPYAFLLFHIPFRHIVDWIPYSLTHCMSDCDCVCESSFYSSEFYIKYMNSCTYASKYVTLRYVRSYYLFPHRSDDLKFRLFNCMLDRGSTYCANNHDHDGDGDITQAKRQRERKN